MPLFKHPGNRAILWLGSVILAVLIAPAPARSQEIAREALASFPSDTRQLAYTSLAQLRYSPNYFEIRNHLLQGQLRAFADFLRSLGTDPDKSIDEVILGWRGQAGDQTGFFGLAQGTFRPDLIRQEFARNRLPTRDYGGIPIYTFGTGADSRDLFFTFLDSSLAAFGRWPDLKAILSARQGDLNSLETNQVLASWEREAEAAAPQWGVMTGESAANLASGWLAAGKGLKVSPSALLGPIQAVLYSIDWDGGFTTHLTVICQTRDNASALSALLNVLRSARSPSAVSSLLQSVETRQDGAKLLITLSGPIDALDPIVRP